MDQQAASVKGDEMKPGSGNDELPRAFGKYTLMRRLAAGGMAEIYLALRRSVGQFEKFLVIKRILPSMNNDRAFIEMLVNEATLAATLSHSNIVHVYDVGQVDGTYYIAMEHIEGEDIQSIVRAMKHKGVTEFPLEHTLGIILGVCAGLAYAHEKCDAKGSPLGIVHRDISPRNIVVSYTGDVKIVDFGIAKSGLDSDDEEKDGQLKGKAPYMSPEQAAGQGVDWRSDIFSTGVMLFELTTGRRLFKGASEYETLKMICERDYPRPSQVRPGYPPALDRIVMRALAKRREERYQSAREMQADLEDFIREERIPVSQVSLTRWMQSLFGDKVAQQKEALLDIKHLADEIASQRASALLFDGGPTTSTGSLRAADLSSIRPAPPPKRSPLGLAVLIGVLLGLGGSGFFYLQSRKAAPAASTPETEAKSEPQAASATVASVGRGSITVDTTPHGCAIWIDGDLRPEVTPATIDKLPFDRKMSIKLTKEGLEPHRENITLSAAEPQKTIKAELSGGSVTVVLKIAPPPNVWVDGKPWTGEKGRIEGLSANEEHKIVVAAPGYGARTYTFSARSGETKTIDDRLVRLDQLAPY